MKKTYQIQERMWLYPGKSSWHFITIPQETAKEIDFYFEDVKQGWGSLPVFVTIGKTSWKTSVFTDKKTDSYLLPIKAQVRKAEQISAAQLVSVKIELER